MTQENTALSGLLGHLAAFAAEFQWADAPEVVRRQAVMSILDTVGCMVAGEQASESRAFTAHEIEGPQTERASIVGQARKVDTRTAIRINAYLGDVFELNDLTGGHASIAVVPTALAEAEAQGRSGRDLIEAVIVGIEVTSRVYAAYYPTMKSYEATGIAPPGIPSTIGAAAAAARLSGFSAEQTERTLAIAAALAGWCPAEVIFGQGGTIKPMLFGSWPGSVASQAVGYARAGFSGPSRVLESPIGLYATLANRFDASVIESPTTWYLAEPRRKRHACCGYIHSAIDGVITMRQSGVDVAKAARISVGMPAYIIPGVSKSGPPTAPNEARFHAEYCIALAAQGADAITPEHSVEHVRHMASASPLMARIGVVEDPTLSHYHQSVIRLFDEQGGEIASRTMRAPKGAPLDPMSDGEVQDKFRALVAARLSGNELDAYLTAINTLDSATECGWIVRRFS